MAYTHSNQRRSIHSADLQQLITMWPEQRLFTAAWWPLLLGITSDQFSPSLVAFRRSSHRRSNHCTINIQVTVGPEKRSSSTVVRDTCQFQIPISNEMQNPLSHCHLIESSLANCDTVRVHSRRHTVMPARVSRSPLCLQLYLRTAIQVNHFDLIRSSQHCDGRKAAQAHRSQFPVYRHSFGVPPERFYPDPWPSQTGLRHRRMPSFL